MPKTFAMWRNYSLFTIHFSLFTFWMGFIFWPKSSRYVSERAAYLPTKCKRVGVFVDDMPQSIVTRVYNYDLDYVQLHGEESKEMIENFRRTVDPDIKPGIKIIKTISVGCKDDIQKYKEYVGVVDMFLFDTKCACDGGSGKSFDWSILNDYDGEIPFLLSGGIGPDDVEKVKAFQHPQFAGIDLNSCFETEPGVKDVEKLKTFISQFK